MRIRLLAFGLLTGVGLVSLSFIVNAEPPGVPSKGPMPDSKTGVPEKAAKTKLKPITVEEARERARLMYNIYSVSLEVLHHHYFRHDKPTLPARAMEDIFIEIDERMNIESRWIAVNTPPMSVSHAASTPFEKKAAEEISAGKTEYDSVEKGYYQYAGVIPLKAGCVGCHTKLFSTPVKTPRFAGLVIRIPVKDK